MPKFNEQVLLSFCWNSDELDLSNRNVREADLMDITNFLNRHPHIKTINLSNNQISDDGAKAFAVHNKTATTVNLSWNEISDIGAKALASNLVLQRITADHSTLTEVGQSALNEKNPLKRATYGRDVGLPIEVPSLLRLSLFSRKEKLIFDNQGQLRSFNKDNLMGLEDLVSLLNQNKI